MMYSLVKRAKLLNLKTADSVLLFVCYMYISLLSGLIHKLYISSGHRLQFPNNIVFLSMKIFFGKQCRSGFSHFIKYTNRNN